MMTERFDRIALGKVRHTPQGFIVVDGAVSRIGVQSYDGPSGKVAEFRSPAEVFARESMASLAGAPIVVGHPAGMIARDDPRKVGYVGEKVRRDGDYLVATLTFTDPSTIKKILSGELKELSCGYRAEISDETGIAPCGERYDRVQRKIVHNHLALLPPGEGRCGASCALRTDAVVDRLDSNAAYKRMVERNRELAQKPLAFTSPHSGDRHV
jgi:hypothetical protein